MLTFFDEWGKPVPWNGEPVQARPSVYAVIEREVRPFRFEVACVRSPSSRLLKFPGSKVSVGKETVPGSLADGCLKSLGLELRIDRLISQNDAGFFRKGTFGEGKFYHAFRSWYSATIIKQALPQSETDAFGEITWIAVMEIPDRRQQLVHAHVPVFETMYHALHGASMRRATEVHDLMMQDLVRKRVRRKEEED